MLQNPSLASILEETVAPVNLCDMSLSAVAL